MDEYVEKVVINKRGALHWKMRLRNPYKECGIPLYMVCVLNMLENVATNQTITEKNRMNCVQKLLCLRIIYLTYPILDMKYNHMLGIY